MSKLYLLAFTELRLIGITNKYERVSNKRLVEAVTINEELKNLGYTLNTEGIRQIANCTDMKAVLDNVREMTGNVDAKPMYPDFPNQVLNMDEAEYRLHQMIHYFTTYGIEWLTGETVDKGWVPNITSTEKTEKDIRLLESKVIEVINLNDLAFESLSRVLSKRERMTDKERELVLEALDHFASYSTSLNIEDLSKINVPFKQNLMYVCNFLLDNKDISKEVKLALFKNLCKNTGDVWKVIDYCLTRHKFHFKTSQKRFFVQLLESYNHRDFGSNLIITNKKADRVKLLLNYIDYNTYSRNPLYSNYVHNLRNGTYQTWEGGTKRMIETSVTPIRDKALSRLAGRPGIMLRWLTYLLRHDFAMNDIEDFLLPFADALNTQTLVTILTKFGKGIGGRDDDERSQVIEICNNLLAKRLASNSNLEKFNSKKIYIDEGDMNFAMSEIHCNDKSDEGGYIRSGMAYRIPKNVNTIRFFTYWNDKKRVDVDLHARATCDDGSSFNIGWNANYKNRGLVMSGDMTFSDSAEFVDVDLNAKDAPAYVGFIINIYDIPSLTKFTFKDIETCFVGIQAVNKMGEDIALYNPENCFFKHYLNGNSRCLTYGYLDLKNRTLVYLGEPCEYVDASKISNGELKISSFTLDKYLDMLLRSAGCERVFSREDANFVFVMGKLNTNNEISLADNNFFMD